MEKDQNECKQNYLFFQNKECEFFPCHKGEEDAFNCLFCYCPLYTLGETCGGHFTYLENGVKDCSGCLIPHAKTGHEYILTKAEELWIQAKPKNTHHEKQ